MKLHLTVACSCCTRSETLTISPDALGPIHLTVRQAMRAAGWLPSLQLSGRKGGQHWEQYCPVCVHASKQVSAQREVSL
jgi:hypothetical protein